MKTLISGPVLIDHLIYSELNIEQDVCNKLPNKLCSGGTMRNVAFNLATLGLKVDFLSVWGNDDYAGILKKELNEINIKVFGPTLNKPTPIYTSLSSLNNKLSISSLTMDFYVSEDYNFHYSNYEWLLTNNANPYFLSRVIKENPKISIITCGFLPDEGFSQHIKGLILNRQEFFNNRGNHDYFTVGKKYPSSWLIVTLDQDGVYYGYLNKEKTIPNKNTEKNGYPVGCGDAFTAGLYFKLRQSKNLDEAVNYAHQLAEEKYHFPGNTIFKKG